MLSISITLHLVLFPGPIQTKDLLLRRVDCSTDESCPRITLYPSQGAALDKYGSAVAMGAGTFLVGAPGDAAPHGTGSGAVYVYEGAGRDWEEVRVLRPSDGEAARFGESLALFGEQAAIGSPMTPNGTPNGSGLPLGAVHVFTRQRGQWLETATLVDPRGASSDGFGLAVSIGPDRILVGAPGKDGASADSGAAFLFVRRDGAWQLEAEIAAPSVPVPSLGFGAAVSLSGDAALIGHSSAAQSAWLFRRHDDGWSLEAELTSPLTSHGGAGGLGTSVALREDAALLGWPFSLFLGRCIPFVRSGTSWTELLSLDGVNLFEFFGFRVALSDEIAVAVGDPFGGDMPLRAFSRNCTDQWTELASVTIGTSEPTDFGSSLVTDGRVVLVGAPRDDTVAFDAGAVHLFDLSCAVPSEVSCRNVPSNPHTYDLRPGATGGDLIFVVNGLSVGYSLSRVFGFDTPVEILLSGGQTLLAADLGGSGTLLDTSQGIARIPPTPQIVGLQIYTQAIHLLPTSASDPAFLLSNAQDTTIGGCPGPKR